MKHIASTSLALLAITLGAESLAAQADRGPITRGALAITNVTVIPMTSESVIRGATVLVRDGRIAEVGRSVSIPADARRINGTGKYLVPGLTDMHVHLFSDGDTPDSVAPYELGAMLANGMTAARFMMGTPEQLALKREVAAGRVAGPQMWLASPEFAGRPYGGAEFHGKAVATPEAARAAVREVADAGYDFIKITLFVNRPAFDALVDEAKKRNMKVVGHVSSDVGVPHALAAGQHIEHLDNYLEHVMADSASMTGSVSDRFIYQPKAWESIDHIDDAKIARVAGLTARSGTWTTPTLTVFRNAFGDRVGESALRTWPDWHMYSSEQRGMWLGSQERYWSTAASEARRKRWVSTRNRLVKAIADSGGRIMTGSDTPEFIHSYGWTLHRELESLVAAGLTPLQALAASTITPARFFGAEKEFGTIERGKRADFVLLAADPLADIRNTTKIDGVSSGGRWFDAAALDGMKRAAMTRLSGSAPQ